jgi:folylpolyglutamate synthase/dihydropteroate synthase
MNRMLTAVVTNDSTYQMSIDLNLDRLQRLVTHLHPYTRPTIHIAGTNGKGSVSALLTSILLASHPVESHGPLRVGRYNSPHLISILDCITIDNKPISRSLYDETRKEV